MNTTEQTTTSNTNRVQLWAGRILTVLLALAFGLSCFMKLKGGPEFAEGSAQLGLPDSMRISLGMLELICLVIYLVPQTSIIGAILLTGYMGGAILAHWRVGEAFIPQIVIGVLVWLALCLREPRLWALMPIRR